VWIGNVRGCGACAGEISTKKWRKSAISYVYCFILFINYYYKSIIVGMWQCGAKEVTGVGGAPLRTCANAPPRALPTMRATAFSSFATAGFIFFCSTFYKAQKSAILDPRNVKNPTNTLRTWRKTAILALRNVGKNTIFSDTVY
jgi:hypothetical protein